MKKKKGGDGNGLLLTQPMCGPFLPENSACFQLHFPGGAIWSLWITTLQILMCSRYSILQPEHQKQREFGVRQPG